MSGTTGPTIDVRGLPLNAATLTALTALLSGGGTTTGGGTTGGGTTTGGGATTPPPVTTPPPILQMPADITGNMPVSIGTGPDPITLQLNYGGPQATDITFAVLFCGVAVAGPLTLTSTTTAIGGVPQVFTILGNFDQLIPAGGQPNVTLQGINLGFNNLSVQSCTYKFVAMISNTIIDSRSAPNGAGAFWVSNNANPITFIPAGAAIAPPAGGAPPVTTPPAATNTDSTISGALINGTAAAAGTLQAIVTAAPAGAALQLPASPAATPFYGAATIPVALTIVGNGMQLSGPGAAVNAAATVISGAITEGLPLSKAIIVPQAAGVSLANMTLTQGTIPSALGNNGAAVRDSDPATGGGGVGCSLTDVEISFCQDGILSAGSGPWVLTNCYLHDNGAGDGLSHNLYFNGVAGDVTNTVSLVNCVSVAGLLATHALKSRAMVTTCKGCQFTGNPDPNPDEPVAGSVVDTPNGGLVSFDTCTFTILPGAANPIFYGYAIETTGASNNAAVPAGASNVTFTNCVFDGGGVVGDIQNGTTVPGATITFVGCTYKGTAGPPKVNGFATVTGTIAAAAA
jgi:hypothetical protein